jgi:hypothetical protein
VQDLNGPDEKNSNRNFGQPIKNGTVDPSAPSSDQRHEVRPSETPKSPSGKRETSARIGTATGPRTAAGKKRSSRNAIKYGIFSDAAFVEGEPTGDYQRMADGFRETFQPEGMFENILVEKLAIIIFRQRRLLLAERAEIADSCKFKTVDLQQPQFLDLWDRSHAGESSGGMLRDSSNPFVIQEAKEMLTKVRSTLEKSGFRKDDDFWLLKKIYGLDHDNAVPFGIFHQYFMIWKLAMNAEQSEPLLSPDNLKKYLTEILDQEIKRLEFLETVCRSMDEERGKFKSMAALVPSQTVMERLIRYEAHLSREFDRTLSQLERRQRIRQGQPVLPSIKIDL